MEINLHICDLFLGSHFNPPEDCTVTSSPGPSYLKRKRSADVQFFQKEKSFRIKETKSSVKETSTSPSKQGSSKNVSKDGLDLYSILKNFRLEPKLLKYAIYISLFQLLNFFLSKKKQYQILYFPMTAPLTDRERMQRKEVTCLKIS